MDTKLYRVVNRVADRTGWAHWFFVGVAKYGIAVFAVALVVGWWQARRADSPEDVVAVAWTGAAALLALGVGQAVGTAVGRARPYAVMPSAHVLIARTSDFSFPSDHATVAGAVAVGLVLAGRRLGRPGLGWSTSAFAAVMAFSRVYVGAHYPGDVLAGLALGGGVAGLGLPVAVGLLGGAARRLAATPVRPLLTSRPAPVLP